jgi:hypothetical protein
LVANTCYTLLGYSGCGCKDDETVGRERLNKELRDGKWVERWKVAVVLGTKKKPLCSQFIEPSLGCGKSWLVVNEPRVSHMLMLQQSDHFLFVIEL